MIPRGRALPDWLLPAGVGADSLVLAQAIRFLGPADFDGPVFWPAAGLALGALLITEHRRWVWILVAVALGEIASNLVSGLALLPSLGWALATVIHPLVAAVIIRRLHPRFALESLPQLAAFVLVGAGLGPLLSATIGTLTGVLGLGRGWDGWLGWWIGDGLGARDVDLHVDPNAPRLAMVERGHLSEILTNLVANARKYGRPPVEIRLTAAGAQLRIEVADHGAGVDPAVQPVMFEPCTRAGGPGTGDPEQGVGLGLAIVRTLAEANGGRVDYRGPMTTS